MTNHHYVEKYLDLPLHVSIILYTQMENVLLPTLLMFSLKLQYQYLASGKHDHADVFITKTVTV